jgi:hypothetical protein
MFHWEIELRLWVELRRSSTAIFAVRPGGLRHGLRIHRMIGYYGTRFTSARSATLREYEHDLTSSNCYASGTFDSESGVSGDWKIDRSRRGFIHVRHKEPEYYYCGECKSQLFYEPCDMDCVRGE